MVCQRPSIARFIDKSRPSAKKVLRLGKTILFLRGRFEFEIYFPVFSKSALAFLIERIFDGSDVIIWSSVYEAMTFIATCFSPAKNIPSPTSDSRRRYFSSSVRLKVFWSLSIDVADCFNRI